MRARAVNTRKENIARAVQTLEKEVPKDTDGSDRMSLAIGVLLELELDFFSAIETLAATAHSLELAKAKITAMQNAIIGAVTMLDPRLGKETNFLMICRFCLANAVVVQGEEYLGEDEYDDETGDDEEGGRRFTVDIVPEPSRGRSEVKNSKGE
jgi:hypothetical protein